MTHGKKLKKLLKANNIKQKDLSAKLDIPETTLSSWMNKQYLKIENIEKVCEALGLETWEFFVDQEKLAEKYTVTPELLEISQDIKGLGEQQKEKLYQLIKEAIALAKLRNE